MTRSITFFLSMICIIFVACDKDDNLPTPTVEQPINLEQLTTGQSSMYVRLDGICGFDDYFNYSQDTIILDVVDIQGDLHFRESFTKGSPLYDSNPYPVIYPVFTEDDFILIPKRDESALFFFYGNDTIRTNPTPDLAIEQNGCMNMVGGEPFEGDAIAELANFELHDISLDDQIVVSCVPVFFELEAYLMYRDGELNLSYTLSSGFPGITFQGWKLLK